MINTDLEKVEWVAGDLNDKSTIAPTMTGVKMVIFAAGAHGWEDIENNRRIYAEAVGEIARVSFSESSFAPSHIYIIYYCNCLSDYYT